MNRLLPALLLSAASLFATTPPPVPAAFQDIYSNLSTQISSFESTVRAGWNGVKSPVIYASQLQSADSTSYTALLGTDYYAYNVTPELQELQALGVKSVTVHISFPILYQPFYTYTGNPSQYQDFVNFYQQVATDVRSRGMKLIVESVVGRPFAGNDAGAFTPYFQTLSWSAYTAGRAQNALNVAQLVQPDYLSVITEPDSEATCSLQPNAGTVSGSTQLLKTILTALAGGGASAVQVGAGTGTWIANFTQYIQSYTATSIKYFDLHVYPVNQDDLTAVLSAADTIHAAKKQVAISEAWDYKVRDDELGILQPTALFARDPFTFWEPIDSAFLQALSDFANYKQLLFVSPYWSHYLFAYLDYNAYGLLANVTILNDSYSAANTAALAGAFTPTGLAWKNLAIAAPDTTAPAVPRAPLTTSVFPNSIQLSWAATTDNVGVAAYHLYRDGTLLSTTSQLFYDDQNLTPGETYSYTLAAFDASGNVSGISSPLSVETIDTTPPTVPANLHVTAATKSSVSLAWDASQGIGGVGGYRILRGSSRTNMTIHGTSTTTTYTDHNAAATTYYYAVESFNPLQIASQPGPALKVTTPAQ